MKKHFKWFAATLLLGVSISVTAVSLVSCSSGGDTADQKTINNAAEINSYETPKNSAVNAEGDPSFPWATNPIESTQLTTISGSAATTITPYTSSEYPSQDWTTSQIISSFQQSVQNSRILTLLQAVVSDMYSNIWSSVDNVGRGYTIVAHSDALNEYSTLYAVDQVIASGEVSYTYMNGGETYNLNYGTDFTYKNFYLNDYSWSDGKWSFSLYFNNATFQNIYLGEIEGNATNESYDYPGGWNTKTLLGSGANQSLNQYLGTMQDEFFQMSESSFANFNVNNFISWFHGKIEQYAQNNENFNISDYENLVMIPYFIGVQANSGGAIILTEHVYVLPIYENTIYDSIVFN